MRKVEVERLYCDCCGKEVKDRFYSKFILPRVFGDKEYEMCEECHKKLTKFLKGFIKGFIKDRKGKSAPEVKHGKG